MARTMWSPKRKDGRWHVPKSVFFIYIISQFGNLPMYVALPENPNASNRFPSTITTKAKVSFFISLYLLLHPVKTEKVKRSPPSSTVSPPRSQPGGFSSFSHFHSTFPYSPHFAYIYFSINSDGVIILGISMSTSKKSLSPVIKISIFSMIAV